MAQNETIQGMFKRLDGLRDARLKSSEQFAYYTIPSVFPKLETTDQTIGVGMLDSVGSMVANHFSNKLITTLFSPNRPFYRIVPDEQSEEVQMLEEAVESGDEAKVAQANQAYDMLRKAFAKTEKKSIKYLENIGYRTTATTAAKLLVITGDTVIRSTNGERSVAYSMRDYVAKKDMSGNDVILIVRDAMAFGSLSEEHQELVREAGLKEAKKYDDMTDITVYTKLSLQADKRYKVTYGVEAVDLPTDDAGMVTKDDSPFTHLSWNLSKGENYGRGLVEDYAGSFHVIDNITTFQLQMAAKAADIKIFVDPASGIDVDELNDSETGTYIAGRPQDVQQGQTGMAQDLQHMEAIIQLHKRQISSAFLYMKGGVRDAERVTAEEMRQDAAELEIAHGGVYSRFASEWQQKVARESTKAVGEDMGDVVEPQILTGMDSISRVGEMQAVHQFVQDIAILQNLPDEALAILDLKRYAEYSALNRGVEENAFVKTEGQMMAEQQAQQEAAQAQVDMQTNAAVQQEGAKAIAQSQGK